MTNAPLLGGKTAVITGAGSGIGQGLAEHAAFLGMNVVVADIDAARVDAVVERLRAQGAKVIGVPTDVRDPAAVEALADGAYAEFGSVTLLANNAGIEAVGTVWDLTPEVWQRVQSINVDGVFNGLHAFLPRMGADPSPSYVVNTASVGAIATAPFNAAYHASKHAILALTECAYLECQQQFPQIDVAVVCPSAVNTRIFEDAEVASGEGAEEWRATMSGYVSQGGLTPGAAAEAIFANLGKGFWNHTHPDEFAFFAGRRSEMLTNQTPPPAALV